ncbi:histidine--tRNA ligase [Candidatus Saccharibacteria bacterium]|nr:histidine--tRNA ligase [Candidatus Saccharibacteria bacterium]
MSLSTQPYKGARDFYPEDKLIQKYMFGVMRRVCERFGYQEYDAPILEPLELYSAKTGEEIVNEQTYAFEDRGGRKVALRPEMTPTVSRLVALKRQEFAYPARLFNIGGRWRYERPQRGRYREFFQLDVDIFGVDNISAELELIQLMDTVLKEFGATESMYQIRINSRKLVDYIIENYLKLDKQTGHDLVKLIDRMNKLEPTKFEKELTEIVGSKLKGVKELLQIEKLTDLPEALKDLQSVKELTDTINSLNKLGVQNVSFDISLMRGFDYYTDIVFEVFDTHPTNNRSMFGGGRYDGLVGLFGVEPIPTVGFAMGDVTLQNFLETNKLLPELTTSVNAVAIILGNEYANAEPLIRELRNGGLNIAVDNTGRKLDKQLKSADKSKVKNVIIIGNDEISSGKLTLKNLDTGKTVKLSARQIMRELS